MVFMSDQYREFDNARVLRDHVVRYTNQAIPVERTESVLSTRRLNQLTNYFGLKKSGVAEGLDGL
jgi:hypothetical protein